MIKWNETHETMAGGRLALAPFSLAPWRRGAARRGATPRLLLRGAALLCLLALALSVPSALAQEEEDAADEMEVRYNDNGEPLINLMVNAMSMSDALAMIARQSGDIAIRAEGKALTVKVSQKIFGRPLLEVLKVIASSADLVVHSPEGKAEFILIDPETYKTNYVSGMTEKRVFVMHNIPPEDIQKMIEGILTEGVGSSMVDTRSGQLIVNDLPQVLAAIEEFLEFMEVKPVIRVFRIHLGNMELITEVLKNESKRISGKEIDMVVDELNRRLIVTGSLNVIRNLETWVEVLDIRPVTRRYPLYNVGEFGEGFENLERMLVEQILTPEAFYTFDFMNSVLIVREVPEKHRDIEALLSQVDRIPAQVLVQAEIIETRFVHSLSYGAQYTFSGGLSDAVLDGLAEIPISGVPAAADAGGNENTYGLRSMRSEFPLFQFTGSGFSADYLSRRAYASFSAAMSDDSTQVLAQPEVYLKNQDTARIHVGTEIPYFTTSFYDSGYGSVGNTGSRSNSQVNYASDGIELDVRAASIATGDLVELDLTISNDDANVVSRLNNGQPSDAVEKSVQEISTVLMIPSGQTRTVGGLIGQSKTDSKGGIPILKNIPWIGGLIFGNTSKSKERRNLLVFLTPFVIRPEPSSFAPEEPSVYEPRGAEIMMADDTHYRADAIKELLQSQFDVTPAIPDTYRDEPTTGDLTTTGAVEGAPPEPEVTLNLQKAKFAPDFAEVPPLKAELKKRLSRDGRIMQLDSKENFVVIADHEENINAIKIFLTEKNVEESLRLRSAAAPEDLIVKAEEVGALIVKKAGGDADDGMFDPLKPFTTWVGKVGAPKGTFTPETFHKGVITGGKPKGRTPTGRGAIAPSSSRSQSRDPRFSGGNSRNSRDSSSGDSRYGDSRSRIGTSSSRYNTYFQRY